MTTTVQFAVHTKTVRTDESSVAAAMTTQSTLQSRLRAVHFRSARRSAANG